jgi:DNA-binding transcriptional ArsR family regulator
MYTIQPTIFLALGEPTRLSIVEMLAKAGELSAGDISRAFSSSASAISQHLKILREAGVVIMQKHAQKRVYTLNVTTMTQIEQWTKLRAQEWNARIDNMDEYIQTLNGKAHE